MLSQFDWSVLLQLHVGDKVGRDRPTEGEDGRHHHLGENVDEDGVNVDVLFIEKIYWVSQYQHYHSDSRACLGYNAAHTQGEDELKMFFY